MNAADAARMTDDNLGAIGLALLKAWRNRQELSTKPRRDR
jgi:hypothetical protein